MAFRADSNYRIPEDRPPALIALRKLIVRFMQNTLALPKFFSIGLS
jgi:hypothetical protein